MDTEYDSAHEAPWESYQCYDGLVSDWKYNQAAREASSNRGKAREQSESREGAAMSSEQMWFLYLRSTVTGDVAFVRATHSRKIRDRWMAHSNSDQHEHGYQETWCYGGDYRKPYDVAPFVWAEVQS